MRITDKQGKEYEVKSIFEVTAEQMLALANNVEATSDTTNFMSQLTLEQEVSWLKEVRREVEKLNKKFFVVVDGEKVVANSEWFRKDGGRQKDNIELGIIVHSDYRRKGIGRALLSMVLKDALEQEHKNMTIRVFGSNPNAQKLYKSLGFEEIARLPDFEKTKDGYADEVIMYYS